MNKVLGDRRAIALLLGPALLVYTLVMLIRWCGRSDTRSSRATRSRDSSSSAPTTSYACSRTRASRRALRFTLLYAVIITAGQVLLGYLLALFYVFVLRNRGSVVRTLVFFPVIIPTVAVALMFQKLFEVAPQTGPVNALLNVFGVASVDWFGSPVSAIVVLVIMDLWRSMGFYAVLLYTGLLDIPDDIMESARLDGANGWRMVRSIVLPLSLPVLLSSIIFSINGTLKVFDSIVALTNGGRERRPLR